MYIHKRLLKYACLLKCLIFVEWTIMIIFDLILCCDASDISVVLDTILIYLMVSLMEYATFLTHMSQSLYPAATTTDDVLALTRCVTKS